MQQSAGQRPPVKVAMVTNIPAPYRIPVYERLLRLGGIDLCVFFCSGREPDREWDLQQATYKQVYLQEKFITYRGRFIHANPDAWARLSDFKPDVVITTGFNPTFLVAYVWARLHGARHIAMTDGTFYTESASLTWVHRLVRRWVYGGTKTFIGASLGAFELYRFYGIPSKRMFQSHLCANNDIYTPIAFEQKSFDFVFSARFIDIKNPYFAMEVAQQVAKRLGRKTRLLMLGSGELDADLRRDAAKVAPDVDVVFAGFVKQAELPAHYASAKLMLFPSKFDPWGVVANESMAAGAPVLVTPMAGVAHDLVLDNVNGYVLELDLDKWVEAAARLLQDRALYERFSKHGLAHVRNYSYDAAAQGIHDAVDAAVAS